MDFAYGTPSGGYSVTSDLAKGQRQHISLGRYGVIVDFASGCSRGTWVSRVGLKVTPEVLGYPIASFYVWEGHKYYEAYREQVEKLSKSCDLKGLENALTALELPPNLISDLSALYEVGRQDGEKSKMLEIREALRID